MEGVRRHLTIVLDPDAVPEVAAARRRWDPVMAAGVPPHVTVVYPEEGVDLLATGAGSAAQVQPFRVVLLDVTALDEGAGGVFVAVDDIDGGWTALRDAIVVGPARRLAVRPHVTIVHPRTSDAGPSAWAELRGRRFEGSVTVTDICVTDTSLVNGMLIVERFALGVTE